MSATGVSTIVCTIVSVLMGAVGECCWRGWGSANGGLRVSANGGLWVSAVKG